MWTKCLCLEKFGTCSCLILWTALSVALGLELRGEYIRGVPCIKKNQQLYCPTAGNSYPLDRIELFIDEHKALMKRMYGEFDMPDYDSGAGPSEKRKRRSTKPGVPDLHFDSGPDPLKTGEPLFTKIEAQDRILGTTKALKVEGKAVQNVVLVTAAVNKNTSGIGFFHMIQIMTARAYLWTGSYFPRVAFVGAAPIRYEQFLLENQEY